MISVLVSKDVVRTREFYKFLRFEFVLEKHGNGPEHFSTLLKEVVCEIYPESSFKRDKTFFVYADDIENCVKNISIYGGRLLEVVMQSDGNKPRQILVEDPDGRILRIIEKSEKS